MLIGCAALSVCPIGAASSPNGRAKVASLHRNDTAKLQFACMQRRTYGDSWKRFSGILGNTVESPGEMVYNTHLDSVRIFLEERNHMLQIKDLSFEVTDEKGQKQIIRELNLDVDEGKFVVITGPNGSGKSTLAKLIAGIEKPTGGQIFFDGQDITGFSITDRANLGISFALQQPVRFKGITVLDLLRLAAKKRLSVGEACTYLSEVGLCAKDYVNREVNASLSGGELKRIEIATVLARSTRLSIFDEPEAGIDLWSFQSLIKVFRHMRDTIHGSILIISHQERILDIADEIVVLDQGGIRSRGTKEEIMPELMRSADVARSCSRIEEGGV